MTPDKISPGRDIANSHAPIGALDRKARLSPAASAQPLATGPGRGKPKLLVVSSTFPYPLISGGKQRVYHVLRELAKSFDLTLLALAEERDEPRRHRAALDFVADVVVVPIRQGRRRQILRLLLNAWRWILGEPAEVVVKRSGELTRRYRQLLANGNFAAAQIEFSQLAPLLFLPESTRLATLFVAHDISFVSQGRKASRCHGLRRWFWQREERLMRRLEVAAWQRAGRVQCMSEVDRDHVQALAPACAVDVIPNGVDTKRLQPHAEDPAPTLVFVGWMRHFPNRDAVGWLMDAIWPKIREAHDMVRLVIVGGGLPAQRHAQVDAEPRVEYLGLVDDVANAVGRATVSVVPIRIGSGSRLKILESMALATPIVTTSIGCEGIPLQDGQHARIADTPDAFARAVLRLLANEQERRQLALAARRLVEERFDWVPIGTRATQSVSDAIGTIRDAPLPRRAADRAKAQRSAARS